jgi:hypothetical protein
MSAEILIAIVLALVGVAAGALLARQRLRLAGGNNPDELHVGAWTINTLAGSKAANALTRARIAISGILALDRKETVYYFCHNDDAGARLDPDGDWEIVGGPFDCRWWSFTLYDEEHFLIDNPARRYSVHSDNVVFNPDGSYRIVISRNQHGANWLSAGNARKLSLTLRLYNPSDAVLNNLGGVKMPTVRRLTARRDAA